VAACTRSCIGVQKSRVFTNRVHYPGIVATIERKLELSALREKRKRTWNALIGCNPTARVAGRTVEAIRNRHDMACEENACCAKGRRRSVALEGFMPIERRTQISSRSCEKQGGRGISDLAWFVEDSLRAAVAVDGAAMVC
jgi:hypothetical protein